MLDPRQKRGLAAVLLAAAAAAPAAFALDPERPLLHAAVDTWTRREGLPSLGINRIVQGPDGYLWLATEAGLVRFDGVRFVVFDQTTDPALRSAMIEDVLPLPDGRLVVATYDGLYRFERGGFRPIEVPEGRKRYTKLTRDRKGGFLALRAAGIDAGDESGVAPLPLRESEGGGTRIAVRDAVFDASGTLWIVADNGKRLLRWDGKGHVGEGDVEEDPLTALGPTTISASALDEKGDLWLVASPDGLLRRRSGRFEPVAGTFPPGFVANRLTFEEDGTLWLASFDGTLVRYRSGKVDAVSGTALAGGEIRTMALDSEGSLWIASTGLLRLRDAEVVTLSEREGWPAGSIASVFVDSKGREYVGPQVGGFLRREGDAWRPVLEGAAAAAPVLAVT
jgi:ligand-binding sensor domain-containing protein